MSATDTTTPEAKPDPRREAIAEITSGFDRLAVATLASGARDKYHVLRRVCEQAENFRRALGEESLRDFDGGLSYAGDGVDGGFAPVGRVQGVAFGQPPIAQDFYREVIGLVKPYLEMTIEQAKARQATMSAVPSPIEPFLSRHNDWTYEVERLTSIRSSFAPGSEELVAVDVRIRDLVLENIKKVEATPCLTT